MWFNKVFNVSLHRSGTQSVHDLLVRAGISSIHWPGTVDGIDYQRLIAGHEDDLGRVTRALTPVLTAVTAISDVPLAALYEELDHRYPESAFILMFRSPFAWARSVRTHVAERDLTAFERTQYWRYLRGRPASLRTVSDAQLHRAYLTHHRDVLAFFEGRSNLLFVQLEDPSAGQAICGFLGVPPLPLRHIDFRRGTGVPTRAFHGV
jgi:hypothetical protein